MGYYTTLVLTADFDTNTDNEILEIRKFSDWYNSLTYEDYMAEYCYTEDWNKFVLEQNYFPELKEFLIDCRSQTVLQEFTFYSIDETTTLTVECEIKNYTDTYEKLYSLLLKCKPIDLLIKERGEEMITPNIYKLKNNELVKIQSGEYDV
jgi:hypothetical protein